MKPASVTSSRTSFTRGKARAAAPIPTKTVRLGGYPFRKFRVSSGRGLGAVVVRLGSLEDAPQQRLKEQGLKRPGLYKSRPLGLAGRHVMNVPTATDDWLEQWSSGCQLGGHSSWVASGSTQGCRRTGGPGRGSSACSKGESYVYVGINYPTSDDLVRETLFELGIESNVEIASMADVPAGTGMGSSGSYLVALLLALHALKRNHQQVWELAEQACFIEMEKAGHPVGKQDQYVAAWGGLNCYEIDRTGHVTVSPLSVPPYALEDLHRCLTLYYTGKRRDADILLGQQAADTNAGNQLVVDSLHRTKEIAYATKEAVESGDLVRFGDLLHRHWVQKKARSPDVSDDEVDRLYERAREAGALGGKVVGAGGGGFLMLLSSDSSSRGVREAMVAEGLREMRFAFDLEGAKVLLNV